MFATVRVREQERGAFAKLKAFIKKPEPILERIDIEPGKFFYHLEIERSQCDESFSVIYRLLGRVSENIIPCDNCNIFSSGLLKRFGSAPYKEILLINSANDYIINDSDSPKKSLLIYDRDGRFPSCCEAFVPYVKQITAVTGKPAKYADIRSRLLEEYGASLVLTERAPERMTCDYALFSSRTDGRFPCNSFAVRSKKENCYQIYRGTSVKPDRKYCELCPQGADITDFTAALYLLCKIKELGNEKYTDFKIVSEICSPM